MVVMLFPRLFSRVVRYVFITIAVMLVVFRTWTCKLEEDSSNIIESTSSYYVLGTVS